MAYDTADLTPLIANTVVYGGGLLWVILAAWYRLRRRIVFEVTQSTVSATHLWGRGAGRRVEWPRAKVSEIKLNSSNAKLIVRVTGVAFVELYLGPNRQLNVHVADVLSAALREPLRAEVIDPAEPLRGATPGATSSQDGVRSRTTRRALLAAAAIMAAAGVVMMFLPLPFGPLGIYLVLFAAAPVGIAMGTQEKKFWF